MMKREELLNLIEEMAYEGEDSEKIAAAIDNKKGKSTKEDIAYAKRKIIDYVVNYELANQEKSKGLNQLIIGFILLSLGIGITGYTYFSSNSQYVLAYGAILVGAWISKEGYKIYRKPIKKLVPKKSIFKKRN